MEIKKIIFLDDTCFENCILSNDIPKEIAEVSSSFVKLTFDKSTIKYVNLGGVENDGHLLNFKKKFHPEIRTSCNEFDLPISPLYYLFKFALKHKKLILKFIKK